MLHFMELFHHAVGCIRNIVHHHIQIDLFRLLTICVERLPHLHAIGVMKHFQNGEFSILIPFVLKNFLNSNSLAGLCNSCFEHNSKGSVSDDFLGIVSQALLLFASFSLNFFVFLKNSKSGE